MKIGTDTPAASVAPTLVEQNIQLVLRGATRVLGCKSATYLHVDERSHTIRIWVGIIEQSQESLTRSVLRQAEKLLGTHLGGGGMEWKLSTGSVVFESWRTGRMIESSGISEIVGQALPPVMSTALRTLVGDRHFACVPVVGQAGPMGVILFEKPDERQFTAGQRELLLSFATRVALVIESERFADSARRVVRDLGDKALGGSPLVRKALSRFLQDAAEAMISLDSAQTITAANARAEEMFRQSGDALKGRPLEVLFTEPESSHRVLESRLQLRSDGFFETRASLVRGDGSRFPAFLSGLVTADEHGEHVGSIVRIRDLGTLERTAEDEDAHKRRVVRSERLAMMGQMAAQLAHEIRNPLVSIGASLRELAADMEAGETDRAEVRADLLTLSLEVERLDATLRDYLALARAPNIQPTRIRASLVLEDAVRVAWQHPSASKRSIDFEPSQGDEILADPDALRQVYINLILNALEASPQGGRIVCSASRTAVRVVTEIKDWGKGLPEGSKRSRIFEPFFSTKPRGSGLGLAISKKIVEDLGGTIALEPAPGGRGTVARVSLPVPGSGIGGSGSGEVAQ